MTATMTYKCGHEGEVPRNMGRGVARENRLADHFGRNCLACRREAAAQQAAKMSVLLPGFDANGKRLMRPYTSEEIAAYVAKHVK
jgi:hypothetical protein